MRILFVYSGNSLSGQNPIVENQARSLRTKGAFIEMFPIAGKGFTGYLKNAKYISDYLKLNKFDIIHAHYGLSALAALLARKKERIVVSFMGDDLIGSNKPNGSVTLWSIIVIKINAFLARFFYDYTIIKTDEMQKNLMKKTRYSIIPNGVDPDVFYPIKQEDARKSLDISPDKKVVLFVSNPARSEKNYPLSDSAVKSINNKNIILFPVFNLSHEQLNLYYNSADILLLTSFHEGSPNVVKEAMACNCPVVSTSVGDINWLFGETPGYYITTYESSDVAEKIKSAIEFRGQNKFASGRERIRKLGLNSKTVSDVILRVYQKVLGGDKSI